MKRKPWSLVIIALLHILAPIGNLLFNAYRSGRTLPEQWFYWAHIIPKYLLFIYVVLPIVAGVLIYICRRWSYWAYLGCLGLVFLSNLYSYSTSMNINTLIALIVILVADIIVVAYFVVPSVQKVYFDPRLRWWEAAPRYHFNHDGFANGSPAYFKNLGQGGLLMTSGPELFQGDRTDIFFTFENLEIRISGVVVYKSANVESPSYGVRFDSYPGDTFRQIQMVIRKLHSQGRIVSERLPGQEDSLGAWLKRLVTKGEGLFPKGRI